MDTCDECGFDGRRLSPQDAAVAARSFPRRFRAAIVRRDDEESTESLIRRRPADGDRSALELIADAAAAIDARRDDVRRILITDDPAVGAPVDPASPGTVDETLARLDGAAHGLAEAIERGRGDDWARTGTGPKGAVTALEAVAAAIHEGVHRLRRIDAVLRAVRGQSA